MLTITDLPAHASNFRRGRAHGDPRLLVIHTMQGGFKGTAAWFACDHSKPPPGWDQTKPYAAQGPSSAHYGISKAGEIARFVDEADTAFHAGNADVNALSVGIELEGDCDDPENFTEPMMAALVELSRDLCGRLAIAISRVTIMGHCDVPDARPGHAGELGGAGHHHDPGPSFDFRGYLLTLSSPAA